MGEKQFYTKTALEALEAQIVTVQSRLDEALNRLGGAAEDDNNTWHDNAAFDQANEDILKWRGELALLKKLRAEAVLHVSTAPEGVADIGSLVTFVFEGDDDTEQIEIGGHHIVRSIETNPKKIKVISSESPLGAALLGHKAKEHVRYTVNGRNLTVTIISVE